MVGCVFCIVGFAGTGFSLSRFTRHARLLGGLCATRLRAQPPWPACPGWPDRPAAALHPFAASFCFLLPARLSPLSFFLLRSRIVRFPAPLTFFSNCCALSAGSSPSPLRLSWLLLIIRTHVRLPTSYFISSWVSSLGFFNHRRLSLALLQSFFAPYLAFTGRPSILQSLLALSRFWRYFTLCFYRGPSPVSDISHSPRPFSCSGLRIWPSWCRRWPRLPLGA